MKYILIFLLSITTSFAQLHVATFGVKGDGVTDDAPALNRAIAAAILKHDKLIIPAPANFYNIKSTLNIVPAPGQTQAWVRIEAWGHRNNFIVYTGPGNQPAVKIIGVKGGAIDGLMVRVANGISGVTVYEIGTEGASNSTGGFVMDNCDASLGDKANIGWRFGFIEGGNADISQILLSECAVWGSGIEGQIGFQNVGRNTLQLTWVGGAATKVDKAVMTTAGGSQFFFGFGGAYNNTDFHIASSNNFAVYGGRFEHGKTFLFTSNASSHPTIAFYGTMLGKYEQPSGYFIDMQRPGTLRLEGLKVENPNKTNRIRLGGNTGAGIGNLTVTGGAWHSSEPIYQIDKPGTWKVTIDNVGKLDANYASSSYFTNTTTPVITPPIDPPVEPPLATNKFVGTYFDNVNFTGTSFTREDSKIAFNWGNGSPDPRITVDTYSAKWEGTFDFNVGAYTFTAKVDDGVRIFVDDEKILESWKDQAVATYTAVKAMTAGIHNVKVEYYENGGSAELTVDWKEGTPVVVPPPPVNVVAAANAKQAIETAAAGSTINLAAGTYLGGAISVPVGVSINCNGTVLQSTLAGAENNKGDSQTKRDIGILNLHSDSKTNGNQTIKGCVLDGRDINYAGIRINNRDNVTIENCQFKDFNFNGLWFTASTGSTAKGNYFNNSGWSDTRYLSGAINIENVTNLTIESNTIRSDKNNKGTGIEALWKETTLRNLKIINNDIRLNHQNPWNGGSANNFAIELHDTHYRGIEIANNYFGNQVSMASHKVGDGSRTWIHHNIGNLGNDRYVFETIGDDFLIEHNVMENAQMFINNTQPNTKWKNWIIRNNELKNSSGHPSWGGIIIIGHLGVSNVVVQDNKFPAGKLIHYMRDQGGVTLIGSNQ